MDIPTLFWVEEAGGPEHHSILCRHTGSQFPRLLHEGASGCRVRGKSTNAAENPNRVSAKLRESTVSHTARNYGQ